MFSRISHHKIEIMAGTILLLISALLPRFGLSNDVAWFAGIQSVLLPLTAAIIKSHFISIVEELAKHKKDGPDKCNQLAFILSELDGIPYQYASQEVSNTLSKIRSIQDGEIPLNSTTYFHLIIHCMNEAPSGSMIYAVNSIDELRWRNDPREKTYLRANHKARQRGVKINRVFILDKELVCSDSTKERLNIIKEQVEADNIQTYIVWKTDLNGQEHCVEDWVYFEKPNQQLFVDFADPIDTTRVAKALLIIDQDKYQQYIKDFRILCDASITNQEFIEFYNKLIKQL